MKVSVQIIDEKKKKHWKCCKQFFSSITKISQSGKASHMKPSILDSIFSYYYFTRVHFLSSFQQPVTHMRSNYPINSQ